MYDWNLGALSLRKEVSLHTFSKNVNYKLEESLMDFERPVGTSARLPRHFGPPGLEHSKLLFLH